MSIILLLLKRKPSLKLLPQLKLVPAKKRKEKMSQKWGGKKLLKAVYILRSRRFWRSLGTNGLWLFSLGPLWLGFLQWMTSSVVLQKLLEFTALRLKKVPKSLIFLRIKLTPVLSSSLIVNSLFVTTFKFCLKL